MNKKILVAAAWPYANGSLHLGHVAGLIPADIIARYYRLKGDDVLYISGSDCHGTPITVAAQAQGVEPIEIAEQYHKEFIATLIDGLGFSYDNYTTTLTANHTEVVQDIFTKLYEKNLIYTKVDKLPYCPTCDRFLPDRFVEGECPHCHFKDARGDQCDNCGKLLNPNELINPRCKTCGGTPEWRDSEHFYLKLSAMQQFLEDWSSQSTSWRPNAIGFTKKLLAEGLHDRAITRDTTWGIPIPLPGYDDKRIYVWFEAVSGYLSASIEWAKKTDQPEAWKQWWENNDALHYYVHGKDNIPFHTIIWPSILHGYDGLHLPDRIISSEYLTLEKEQLSKSRHWFILLKDFLESFDADTLRFYLLLSGPETGDTDFSWSDFRARINAELIGNFGNFVNRTISITYKNFPEGVKYPAKLSEIQTELVDHATKCFKQIGELIEAGHLRNALREFLALTEHCNRYFNDAAPWLSVKEDNAKAEADLAVAIQLIRCLSILICPILPKSSENIQAQIREDKVVKWSYPQPFDHIVVGPAEHLYRYIEEEDINKQYSLLGK